MITKDLGMVTAYAYAVSKGYTGTETQFAELMASYASVAQEAVNAALAAAQSAQDAESAKDTAQTTVSGAIAGIQAEGQTQIGAVQSEGTTQVGNVNSAGTTQVGAVQAKGTEVINSIPSDYTELSDDVTGLKSAINKSNIKLYKAVGVQITDDDYTPGGHIKADGTLDLGRNDFLYTKMYPIPDSATYIHVEYWYNSSDALGIAFYSENAFTTTAFISGYPSSTYQAPVDIPVPNGAKFLASSKATYSGSVNYDISASGNIKTYVDTQVEIEANKRASEIEKVNERITNIPEYTFDGFDVTTVDIPGRDGGRTDLTGLPGYINKNDGKVYGETGTWIHSDFIAIDEINGDCGTAWGHSAVADIAYYSSDSFDTYLGFYNLSGTRTATELLIKSNAPNNAKYVIITTDSTHYSLFATLTKKYPVEQITIRPIDDSEGQIPGRYMHFSFDDTNRAFKDLTANANTYTSVFDSPFFGALKQLHDQYGVVFSCYCFYNVYTDSEKTTLDFCIENCTSAFADEFAENAAWLRFGFHSVDNYTIYSNVDAVQALSDYNNMITQLLRITGSVKCIDTCIRTQSFTGTKDNCVAFRDAPCGAIGFLTSDYGETGGAENFETSSGYYLNATQYTFCGRKGRYFDPETQLYFFPSNLRLDSLSASNIDAYLAKFNTAIRYNRSHMMIMYAHENQMFNNIQGYVSIINKCCEWALSNNYHFMFPMDKINAAY